MDRDALFYRFLDVIEHDIAPLTARGVSIGSKVFGAAVLLKNDGLLPLSPKARVTLIGPFAADRANMLGTWAV